MADEVAREILLTGRPAPPDEGVELVAGPVRCMLDGIDLRDVRAGDCEIADLVFVAVHDEAWNTIPGVVEGLDIAREPNSFSVTFLVRHVFGKFDLRWSGRIEGTAEGVITYALDGESGARFAYNRIGLNVFHRARSIAGRAYRTTLEGRVVQVGRFAPELSPQSAHAGRLRGMLEPFSDLTIDHGACGSVDFHFDGDDFEIEDQRNFGDASLKTYSTPLQRPAPFVLERGTRIAQSLTMTFHPATLIEHTRDDVVEVRPGSRGPFPMPEVGLGVASDGAPLSEAELQRLRPLAPRHLRVEWDVQADPEGHRVTWASEEARRLGVTLEVEMALAASAAVDLRALAAALARDEDVVSVVLVRAPSEGPIDRGTPARLVATVRAALANALPAVPVGSSVNMLASLTREPVDARALGLVGVPLSPTVHRGDDITIMENVESFGDVVATASAWMDGLPVRISPVTLATLRGPFPLGPGAPGDLPRQVDTRQPALFTAAFTTAALGQLLPAGAEAITLYETAGWRGVIERDAGPTHEHFRSLPGSAFPVWHVLADLADARGGWPLRVEVSDGRRVGAWAVGRAGETCLSVANLTREPVAVRLPRSTSVWSLRLLDAATAAWATRSPREYRAAAVSRSPGDTGSFVLDAYAVATMWLEG